MNLQKRKELMRAQLKRYGHKPTRFYSCMSFDKDMDEWVTSHFIKCTDCKKEFYIKIYKNRGTCSSPVPGCPKAETVTLTDALRLRIERKQLLIQKIKNKHISLQEILEMALESGLAGLSDKVGK